MATGADRRVTPLWSPALDPYRLPDGRPLELFGVLAHAPAAIADLKGATARALDGTTLPVRLREVLILRVLHNLGAAAEWEVHVALFGDAADLSPDDLTEISGVGPSPAATHEHLMMRAADAMCAGGDLDARLWGALEASLGVQGAVETVFVSAQYVKVAIMSNAFQLRPQLGDTGRRDKGEEPEPPSQP